MPTDEDVRFALTRLRERAAAEEELSQSIEGPGIEGDDGGDKGSTRSAAMARTAKALRRAGRISFEEFLFQVLFCADRIVDDRMSAGLYASELSPIELQIDNIERSHGLLPDEYWLIDEGPPEWQELNARYSAVLSQKLRDVLDELGFDDVASFMSSDTRRFEEAEEKGRALFMRESPASDRVASLLESYLSDSHAAESAGAFYAAVAMRGAALEARLLLKCLNSQEVALAAREALPSNRRPSQDMLRWSLSQLLAIAVAAGWLPNCPVGDGYEVNTRNLAELVRQLRNFLHPGRHVLAHTPSKVEASHAADTRAALIIIELVLTALE